MRFIETGTKIDFSLVLQMFRDVTHAVGFHSVKEVAKLTKN